MYLYSFRRRTIVANSDFRGVVPDNFINLPSLRLAWKVYKLSFSTNKMSGMFIFNVLAPLRHRASKRRLSQWLEALLTALNRLPSSAWMIFVFYWKQRLHLHALWLVRKLCGSIVFYKSLIAKGLTSWVYWWFWTVLWLLFFLDVLFLTKVIKIIKCEVYLWVRQDRCNHLFYVMPVFVVDNVSRQYYSGLKVELLIEAVVTILDSSQIIIEVMSEQSF